MGSYSFFFLEFNGYLFEISFGHNANLLTCGYTVS